MRFFRDFLELRGRRVISCPETGNGEAVKIDALHAALSGELRLSACTRWPERADCAQPCLSQITSSPDGCRVKSIVTSWYAGKACAVCARPIGPIVWHQAPPALLRSNGSTCEWKDVRIQDLPGILQASWPLCWTCNNVEELERLRPDLVTRRTREAERAAPPLRCDNLF